MLVFIDESGDPGFKLARGSSPTFVIAMVAFSDPAESVKAQKAIEGVSVRHKLKSEFKFSKTRPEVRDDFFEALKDFDFCVRAIVIQKEKIHSEHLRTRKEAFYSFFVKSMLRFDNGLLKNATVIIDGSGDREFKRELSTYIKKHTGEGSIKTVRFSDSKNDRLVQMSDMCTGAIARSYRNDRDDKDRWREMMRPKIQDVWEFK